MQNVKFHTIGDFIQFHIHTVGDLFIEHVYVNSIRVVLKSLRFIAPKASRYEMVQGTRLV